MQNHSHTRASRTRRFLLLSVSVALSVSLHLYLWVPWAHRAPISRSETESVPAPLPFPEPEPLSPDPEQPRDGGSAPVAAPEAVEEAKTDRGYVAGQRPPDEIRYRHHGTADPARILPYAEQHGIPILLDLGDRGEFTVQTRNGILVSVTRVPSRAGVTLIPMGPGALRAAVLEQLGAENHGGQLVLQQDATLRLHLEEAVDRFCRAHDLKVSDVAKVEVTHSPAGPTVHRISARSGRSYPPE